MGDTQENWVTPPNDPSFHLKYHLKLKTKEDVGWGELGGEEVGYGRLPGKQG